MPPRAHPSHRIAVTARLRCAYNIMHESCRGCQWLRQPACSNLSGKPMDLSTYLAERRAMVEGALDRLGLIPALRQHVAGVVEPEAHAQPHLPARE